MAPAAAPLPRLILEVHLKTGRPQETVNPRSHVSRDGTLSASRDTLSFLVWKLTHGQTKRLRLSWRPGGSRSALCVWRTAHPVLVGLGCTFRPPGEFLDIPAQAEPQTKCTGFFRDGTRDQHGSHRSGGLPPGRGDG